MKTPEEDIQEAIWFLRDIQHEYAKDPQHKYEDADKFVRTVAPHLLTILRVSLKMVQTDESSVTSSVYGCKREVTMAQALHALIPVEEEFDYDIPVTEHQLAEEDAEG